jgi:hypothetical protein
MAVFTLAHKTHAALARFRRRTWAVVGLCLVFQIGNVALHANEHEPEDTGQSASMAAANTPSSGLMSIHNHNHKLGSF